MLNYVFGKYYVKHKIGNVIHSLNTGLNPRKFFKLNTDDANNYYVTIREIRGGILNFSKNTDMINDEALRLCNKRSNLEVGDVLFSGTGTIGEMHVIENEPNNWNIKEGVYSLKPNTEVVISKYLKYILSTKEVMASIMSKCEGGTVRSIKMADLKNIEIPLPPIDVQRRTVEILDVFDAYVNDLADGLPAEIDGRRKQYEFYRNKLLTFNRLGGE